LIAEMLVDSEFFLVFLGFAALVTGGLGAAGLSGPIALQWTIFAVLSVVLLVGFRRKIYGLVRGADPPGYENMVGELAVALDPIAPGGQGRAELHGTTWTARNLASAPLAAGQSIRVERIDGLTIHVRPEES
jgi:membrane protein implicated in regulation of membrane protease activity